jgi:hypothetical protein
LAQKGTSGTGLNLDRVRTQLLFVTAPNSGGQQQDHAGAYSYPEGNEQNALYGSFKIQFFLLFI